MLFAFRRFIPFKILEHCALRAGVIGRPPALSLVQDVCAEEEVLSVSLAFEEIFSFFTPELLVVVFVVLG